MDDRRPCLAIVTETMIDFCLLFHLKEFQLSCLQLAIIFEAIVMVKNHNPFSMLA